MEFSVRHLIKRNGIYYFRYRCPVNYLPGKNLEIKVSLRTGDLRKAVTASKLASEKLRSLIDSGVSSMIPLQEIRKRITEYVRGSLEEQERLFAGYGKLCDGTREDGRVTMLALTIEERSGLKEVFNLARKKKYDVLLFWSLDRFSREGSRKTLEYLTRLDNYGIKWHSYTEEYISSLGIFADAIISLMACLAKQERLRISERTKAGMARAAAAGKSIGRPKTAPETIKQAKQLRSKGLSFAAIGKEMNLSRVRAFELCQ